MTYNLKIEVLVSNIPEDGSIASQFPSQEYVNQQLAKKASLSPEGRLDPSHAPDYTEIPGLYEHIEDTKDAIETSIAESLQDAKGYTNQQLSTGLQTKADLVNGKIPFDQIPFSADIEDQIQINVENITAVVDQKVAQVLEQVNVVATAANSYTDTKVAENKTYVDTTVSNVIEDIERLGVSKAVTIPTYLTPEAGVAADTGVVAGAYYNVRTPEGDSFLIEYRNVGGVPTPSGKSYPSSVALNNIQHDNLKGRDVAGAHPASAILTSSGFSQEQVNNGLNSIAEMLSVVNPENGMRVFLKSYRPGNGVGYLGEANPYKGGNWFIYKSGRAAENDGVFIFNGWERFLESDTYSPFMAGCKCDGVTDDAQTFDKLNFALQKNKLAGRIIIDKDMLINSELPRTGSMTHVATNIKCGVRLVSNVHIEILAGVSIKIGNYFDNSETQVFCAANPSYLSDWTDQNPQNNIHLFGAGTIDSTQAGSMATQHYNNRYLVFLSGCTNFHMYGLTTIGGDYGNIVVGRNKSKGIRFYNNHVKDTTVTASSSHDHSSIWTTAPDCKVYNNRFTDSSPKAQIQMCAFESHGNEHYFYNNTVDGFLVSVLQCAFGWDLTNQPTKNNMFVYGNSSRSWYFMQLWYKGGAFQPYGFGDTFDNIHNAMPYISRDALIAAGVKASIVDIRKLLRRAFVSTNNAIAKDYDMKVREALQFHDNKFFASFSPELEEQFYDMEILMNEGIHIFDNYMKTPKLFTIKNQFTHLGLNFPHVIKNYIWKNNTVDYAGAMSTKPIMELKVHRLNGCTFENHIGQTYPTSLASRSGGSFSVVDPDNSKGNKLSFTFDGQPNITAGISGFGSITNAPFFANNKIVCDQKLLCYLTPLNSDPKRAQFYCLEGPRLFVGFEVMSYPPEAFGSFPMPAKMFNSSVQSDRYHGISFDFSDTNTDTATKNGSVFGRLFN